MAAPFPDYHPARLLSNKDPMLLTGFMDHFSQTIVKFPHSERLKESRVSSIAVLVYLIDEIKNLEFKLINFPNFLLRREKAKWEVRLSVQIPEESQPRNYILHFKEKITEKDADLCMETFKKLMLLELRFSNLIYNQLVAIKGLLSAIKYKPKFFSQIFEYEE